MRWSPGSTPTTATSSSSCSPASRAEAATRRPALVVAAHRLTGPLAGLAGMFGSRLLLRQTSREEHVLAGGDPRGFDPDLPPGVGHLARRRRAGRAGERGRAAETFAGLDAAVPRAVRVVPADHPVLAIVAGRPRAHLERLRATGARVIELGGDAMPSPDELRVTPAAAATVLLGDPEAWLADWAHAGGGAARLADRAHRCHRGGPSRAAARSRPSAAARPGTGGVLAHRGRPHPARDAWSCPKPRANPKKIPLETADFVKSMFRYGPFRRRMIPAASAVCQYRHTAQPPPPSECPEGASA